jgi:hypothetical protein
VLGFRPSPPDPALRADEIQKVTLGQLQEAKNIMKDLDGETSRLSRRPQ